MPALVGARRPGAGSGSGALLVLLCMVRQTAASPAPKLKVWGIGSRLEWAIRRI